MSGSPYGWYYGGAPMFGTGTFDNRSFEHAGGLPAVVESGASEPFELVDGATLNLRVVGEEVSITFDAADFVDISAATAAEVAAVIVAAGVQVDSNVTGTNGVRILTLAEGLEATLEVLGGVVSVALDLPTEPTFGVTNPGHASFWTVEESSAVTEVAVFSGTFLYRFEGFEEGWGGIGAPDYQVAVFDLTDLHFWEDFEHGWGLWSFGIGAAIAAEFDSPSGTVTEEGWDVADAAPSYLDGTFAAGSAEGFSSGWGNDSYAYALGATSTATFDAGESAEDFEETTEVDYVVSVLAVAAGIYSIILDGADHPYVASGGEALVDVADFLAAAVNAISSTVLATPSGTDILLEHVNPGISFQLSLTAPVPGALVKADADKDALWIGRSHLPT